MRRAVPADKIAAVPDQARTPPTRRVVHLDLEPGEAQLHGRVDGGNGDWRPFWGWLELMQAIEDAIAAPDTAAEDRQDPDG
jgi:hypothetical protein